MYILGLSLLGETSASLIKDGRLMAAAEEERFSRKKHTDCFPCNAIKFCLAEAGIGIEDIDYIGTNYNPILGLSWIPYLISSFPRSLSFFGSHLDSKFTHVLNTKKRIIRGLNGKAHFKYCTMNHHMLHAASTFFVSPFDDAAILSIDAMGEWQSTILARGHKNTLTKIQHLNFPHSLGFLYGAITDYLGFNFGDGEGKVMGLAAYGKPAFYKEFRKLIELLPKGKFKINTDYFNYQFNWHQRPLVSKLFIDLFGPVRKDEDRIEQKHMDIAASLQAVLEESAIHIANELYKKTRLENLCLAGGVALNCLMNSSVLKNTPFKDIYIQPAANDAGTSLGACFYIYHQILGKPRSFEMKHAYWGPSYNEDDYLNAIKKNEIKYIKSQDTCKEVALLLSQGRIGGWFQGRMEFGPRALGNRSIIADPRIKEMKGIINKKVKLREPFRPFAPSVLKDKVSEYFNLGTESPFMLLVADVKKYMVEKIPAVVHVDGTARVQTVDRDTNPKFWSLIKEFESMTGVPLILNTSFNGKDEPIVCTPEEAIGCFMETELDFLCLGDYLLCK